MQWTFRDQRRFTSIWLRSGGFNMSEEGKISLAPRRTPEQLKYQRRNRYRGIHDKYPGHRERRWWTRIANMQDSPAFI